MEFVYTNFEKRINAGGCVKGICPKIVGCTRINGFYCRLFSEFVCACKKKSGKVFGRIKSSIRENDGVATIKTDCFAFCDGEKIFEKSFTMKWSLDNQTVKNKHSKRYCPPI